MSTLFKHIFTYYDENTDLIVSSNQRPHGGAGRRGPQLDAAAICRVHPSFRVVATAETPPLWSSTAAEAGAPGGAWLGSELLGLFHFHTLPRLSLLLASACCFLCW